MFTVLWLSFLLTPVARVLSASDILFVTKHDQYTLPVEILYSSIISDDELKGELDYLEFETDRSNPSGVNSYCYGCPYAVADNSPKGYRWLPDVSSSLDVLWSVENKAVNLNHRALLDNNMRDLHQPQTTTQESGFEYSSLEPYFGPIPITYSAKVVQTRTVQFEDGSFAGLGDGEKIQFYSIDFEITGLDDQDLTSLNLDKTNIHVVRRSDGVVCPQSYEPVGFAQHCHHFYVAYGTAACSTSFLRLLSQQSFA